MDGINLSVGSSFSLDSNTQDSHQRDCKGHHGRFVGPVFDKDDQLIYRDAWIGCKAWGCVTCGKDKLKKLRKRIFTGRISKESEEAGPFGTKLLTLTLPGAEWRSKTTPKEAKKILAKKWDNLQRNLQKTFGSFKFVKVTEKQRDGFPHYHVLMVGKAIAPKAILEKIRELWSYKYFGAFANVDLKIVKNYVHAVRYNQIPLEGDRNLNRCLVVSKPRRFRTCLEARKDRISLLLFS